MTEKFTMDGVTDFKTYRTLINDIESGLENVKVAENIDPDDPALLSAPEVLKTLPPPVQDAVNELQTRLNLDLENVGLDPKLQSQTKSAITRAGGKLIDVVTPEDQEIVGYQLRTPSGFKVST